MNITTKKMAHSEGFELVISVCVANVSAQANIIDVYDSIVNHFKTTNCVYVCVYTVSQIKSRGGYPEGAGELLSTCDCYCIWGDTK